MSIEVPISVILATLDNPHPDNLQYLLKTFYSNPKHVTSLSKSELTHLVSRVNNLLQGRDEYKRWYGSHLVQVLAFNPVILTSGGSQLLVSLIKLINEKSSNGLVFKNASLAVLQIVRNIRGKPSLTRELLTPNLSNIITALIENFERDVEVSLEVLTDLLLKNTTTFRPFLNKFETKLTGLLKNSNFTTFNDEFQTAVCKAYAFLNLTKSNTQASSQANHQSHVQALPDDQWRLRIFQIVDELKEVVQLYDNLIELSGDSNVSKQLQSLGGKLENQKRVFDKLSIDVNTPSTILQISKRIEILTKLLTAFVTSPTPFALRVPLGLVIKIATLLVSISTNYIPVKREYGRESDLGKVINLDVIQTQSHGVKLLKSLMETYKFNILSSSHLILSSLEVVIPVTKSGKIFKIDDNKCLNLETELLLVLSTVTDLLELNGNISDYEVIYKLIDASLLLLQKRTSLDEFIEKQSPAKTVQGQGKKNKNKRNKDSTPLSDILSHSELFELAPSKQTINTISAFFAIVIRKLNKINITYRIKLIKYAVSVSLKQYLVNGKINSANVKLLESLVIHPNDFENFNNLAIVKNLLPNNEVLSLLTNPRFPVLDSKIKQRLENQYLEIEEDEDDEEQEPALKIIETLPSQTTLAEEIQSRSAIGKEDQPKVEVFKSNTELRQIQEEQQTLTFAKEEEATIKRQFVECEMVEDSIPVVKKSKVEVNKEVDLEKNEETEDEGSDFEIPDIDIDSDDE